MNITAYFSLRENKWEWVKKECLLDDGTSILVEVPSSWSQRAINIVASKYLRRANNYQEDSFKQLIDRVCSSITKNGIEQGYFNHQVGKIFYDELYWLLANQYCSFNSPVWFNVGLSSHLVSNEKACHYICNASGEKEITNQYQYPQCSACFIQSVNDDLDDIMDVLHREVKLFKFGSGSGTNVSSIRGIGEKLSNGGRSAGMMKFLKLYDVAAGIIKSGSILRRAAAMRCVDDDHPEILDFINWKSREEKKVQILVANGYSPEFNDPNGAYSSVSGQNGNNSIRLSDQFMMSMEKDEDWNLLARTDHHITKTIKARQLMEELCQSAWLCGDPGVQFSDTINKWHTCPQAGKIRGSNPCSEFMFIDDSACNLASINLIKFVPENEWSQDFHQPSLGNNNRDRSSPENNNKNESQRNQEFDFEEFEQVIQILIISQDILIDMSSYPSAKIAFNSHQYRPLGLGFTNLGGLLMAKGIPYDSDQGRELARKIASVMTSTSYIVSSQLAKVLGPFPGYQEETMKKVLNQHLSCYLRYKNPQTGEFEFKNKECQDIQGGNSNHPKIIEGKIEYEKWEEVLECHQFRNAQMTVIAPTGTISFMMDAISTGIEPCNGLMIKKKLIGTHNRSLEINNNAILPALISLGYDQDQRNEICHYISQHGSILGSIIKDKDIKVFECVLGDCCVHPLGHLGMMAIVQPFISGAISKTVGLPRESTWQDIRDIYIRAYHMGVKSITVYRDQSKQSQPLQTFKILPSQKTVEVLTNRETFLDSHQPERKNLDLDEIQKELSGIDETHERIQTYHQLSGDKPTNEICRWGNKRKLPSRRIGHTFEIKVGKVPVFFRTGLYPDGTVAEIFIDLGYKEGTAYLSLMNQFAIITSLSLQYGLPLKKLVDKFVRTHFEPSGVVEGYPRLKRATSIFDAIFSILANEYLDDDQYMTIQKEDSLRDIEMNKTIINGKTPCLRCGNTEFITTGTCATCAMCSYNSGCG